MQIYLTASDHKWHLDHDAKNILGDKFRVNENGMVNMDTKNNGTLYLNYWQCHVSSYTPDEPAVLFMQYRNRNNTRDCITWTTRVGNYADANEKVAKFLEIIPYKL